MRTASADRPGTLGARLVLAAVLLIAPAGASAQTLTTGAFGGAVVAEGGGALNGVTITVTSRLTGGTVAVLRTNRSGAFALPFLEPGIYDGLFEQIGYYPIRIEGIAVEPGERTMLQVRLPPVEGEVQRVEVRTRQAPVSAAIGAAQRWLLGPVGTLPFEASNLAALAVLSTHAGPGTSFEGLPSEYTAQVVDGFPRADRRSRAGRIARDEALRLSFLSRAELIGPAAEVELPSAAGGIFTGITRTGGGPTAGRLFGDWSGTALAGGDAASFQVYRGGADVSGMAGDSAGFLLVADVERSELPLEGLFLAREGLAPLDAAVQRVDGEATLTGARTSRIDRASVFGVASLPLGERHGLRATAMFASLPHVEAVDALTGRPVGTGAALQARELFAGATLTSRLSDETVNEASAAFEMGRIERADDANVLPRTEVVDAAAAFGSDDLGTGVERVSQIYLRETLQLQRDAHTFKLGGRLSYRPYDLDYGEDRAARLVYATAADLDTRVAAYSQLTGVTRAAKFNAIDYAIYIQDDWVPDPTLRVVAGVRLHVFRMPDSADIRLDQGFAAATGISNRRLERQTTIFEPRVSLSWSPGGAPGWLVRGSATVDGAPVSPDAVAEVLSNDGALLEQAAVGGARAWPDVPVTTTTVGRSLTLLGPSFSGPRTTRLAGGVTGMVGPVRLGLAATYRQTEFLPQRRDLNLLPDAASRDQHGRAIFGPLEKIGSVLAPKPAGNRRLPNLSRVWALEATGTSRYSGVTVSLERSVATGLALIGSYTYSRTEDDWLGGLSSDPEAQLSPFPDDLEGVQWADGRSDFDVPHRMMLGAELVVPGSFGPRIAALYRRESGAPFTAGFRAGVDVNADGSAVNDPAFIDSAVPGMDALLSAWPCLAADVGGIAERNGCRTDDVHTLDARLSLRVLSSDRFEAHFVADALDLLGTERVRPDAAVYLIDPARDLTVSADGATTTIPLVANPNFGQPLTRYAPLRRLRIGLRVRY